jgi:hypothetical protein
MDALRIHELWSTFMTAWSIADDIERLSTLDRCAATDVTYCSPRVVISGHGALSEHMGRQSPSRPTGGHFVVRSVSHHHVHCLTHWAYVGVDGGELFTGSSFGALTGDGHLRVVVDFAPDRTTERASPCISAWSNANREEGHLS